MLEAFLSRYGYVALFGGTALEGETFILLAGFLAHRGYLALPAVLVVAAAGAFFGDMVYFFLGRRYGRAFILKFRHGAVALPRLQASLQRYSTLFLFVVRYVWGVRWAAASLAGASGARVSRFMVIDLAACVVWSTVVGTIGYLAGGAVENIIADVEKYEIVALVGLAALGAAYAVFWYRRGSTWWRLRR